MKKKDEGELLDCILTQLEENQNRIHQDLIKQRTIIEAMPDIYYQAENNPSEQCLKLVFNKYRVL